LISIRAQHTEILNEAEEKREERKAAKIPQGMRSFAKTTDAIELEDKTKDKATFQRP
jgi:hypothetical protein